MAALAICGSGAWRSASASAPGDGNAVAIAQTDAMAARGSKTRLRGTLFLDLTELRESTRGGAKDARSTHFNLRRLYLSIDHRWNDAWAANLTTDLSYEGSSGHTQWVVKKAYLERSFDRWAVLRAGAASMAWVSAADDAYGYRFVEKVLVDRLRFGSSTDWGLHLAGRGGKLGYQVSAINGRGYRKPALSGHLDIEARASVEPVAGLLIAIGGYEGKLGMQGAATPVRRNAHRLDALVAWKRDGLRLGAEWFRADNWKNLTSVRSDAADGWSLWGSYEFAHIAMFARYDHADLSKRIDPDLSSQYWNAGLAIPLAAGFRVALAHKHERLRNGSTLDVRTRETGVWGELKW